MNDLTTKLAEALRLISFASMDRGARDTATEALRLYGAAKAQPVQDEREAFEAWCNRTFVVNKLSRWRDSYEDAKFAYAWEAWQARAALAAAPAPAPAQAQQAATPAPAPLTVDCVGLALDLEARAKTVESQTTQRAMEAAAHGLRLLAGQGKEASNAE